MIKKLLFVTFLVVVVMLSIPAGVVAQPSVPWLDEDWHYRRDVEISNNCGQEWTNYPVQVILDNSFDFAKAQADGSDLRVTTSDGTTLIPFWIEVWDDVSGFAAIWVNLPTFTLGGTMIYFYYGNASAASAADGMATFDEFDDYEGNDVGVPPVAPSPSGFWSKYENNPIMDCTRCGFGSTFYDSDTGVYHNFNSYGNILHYTSLDGKSWTADTANNPVLVASQPWEGSEVGVPMAWKEGSTWYMLYRGGSPDRIGLATSTDAVNWTKSSSNPVLSGDSGAWDDRDLDPWGVIKIGSTYYLWYNTISSVPGLGRATGLATSTDLTTWTKDSNNPIFSGGRFCAFPFYYGGDYYLLIPHYSSGTDFSQIELYRDSSPTFYPADREYLGVAINYGPTDWDDHDQDTPAVLTDDIYRNSYSAAGDQLWVYYAGEGGDGSWRTGMSIEEDIAEAIAGVQSSSLSWAMSGDVTVVDSPVRSGVRSVRLNDTSASAAVTLTASFQLMEQGIVGAWMRRSSTSAGDFDIYLYGGSTLAAVAGLGRNGDFHYWNGAFQPTAINWAVDTWYLVTIAFDTALDQYDFVVYDQELSELVRVEGINFGNTVTSITSAMLYTSGGYIGEAFADDFRVQKWCGSSPTALVSGIEETQQTQAVAGTGVITFDYLDISMDVQAVGTLLDIQVVHTPLDHPQATSAIQSGYWYMNPGGAAGYTVNLTLPHAGLTDPKICKYTAGPGYGWDCYRDAFTLTSVTRNGITSFSDWAVGEKLGPTAIHLESFSAVSNQGVIFLLVGLILISGLIVMRSQWRK